MACFAIILSPGEITVGEVVVHDSTGALFQNFKVLPLFGNLL